MEQIVFFSQKVKLEAFLIPDPFINGLCVINSTTPDSHRRILLIDESSLINYRMLFDNYENYFVYHNRTFDPPNHYEQIILDAGCHNKILDHHWATSKIYFKLGDLLENRIDDRKFEELKKIIFNAKLEEVLEFLHGCLIEKPEALYELKMIDVSTPCIPCIDDNKVKSIEDLWKALSSNPSDDLNSFRELRDALLQMADA